MEQEPIQHVWINHDNDLVDLTLTTTTAARHGKAATKTSETIHTNKKHPFLTKEKGFLTVGQITLGMHVLRADGTYGVVTGWKVVPGAEMMYDLEVAQDHTFTVGADQWVVHNCGGGLPDNAAFSQKTYSRSFVNGPNVGRSLPDVAMDLKSGVLSPADIEVNIVRRGANTLIVNTRSTVTLLMAGVDRSAWNVIDKTGEDTFEKAIDLHLTNNGLTEAGISFVTGPFGIFQL